MEQGSATEESFLAVALLGGVIGECVLGYLNVVEFVPLGRSTKILRGLTCNEVSVALIQAWLGAPLRGTAAELLSVGCSLKALQCGFSAGTPWGSLAGQLQLSRLEQLRAKLPQALLVLNEVVMAGSLSSLTQPLASVSSNELTIAAGTDLVKLKLCLQCFAEGYFDAEKPLEKLMMGVSMSVEYSPESMSSSQCQEIYESGHRWACICMSVEERSPEPSFFCSVKESYLRPAWRDRRLRGKVGRTLLSAPQELNAQQLNGELTWRVVFALYRTDDDEGPESECDILGRH
eukprot:TRINITY_DN7523_c0_g1_i1.p1 TRINITY_DN7523_c0_g1~~TRINITY_DN7523_c0_g1_i1.p1  ORF type:complete len:290 (-),score=58.86 TRINITY_DN7523_c0_g1_i1:131-1000(-)